MFGLAAGFSGPSEPENESKATKYVTSSETEDGSSHSSHNRVNGLRAWLQPCLVQDI